MSARALLVVSMLVTACNSAALDVPSAAIPRPTSSPIGTLAPSRTLAPKPTQTEGPSGTVTPTAAPTAAPTDPRTLGWRGDLESLVTIRENIHSDPWHAISRDDYVTAVNEVSAKVPQLSDDQLLVEITRLASLPNSFGREGHGGIYPWGEGDFGVTRYPLRLYWFVDGVFVVDALEPYRDLIGARVDAIAGHEMAELLRAVEPLVSRDNDQQILSNGPLLVMAANVLHGLGFVPDATSAVEFTVTRNGSPERVAIEPVPIAATSSLLGGHYFWTLPDRPDGPLWLSNLEDPIWWQVEAATLFVGYNQVDERVYFASDDLTAIVESGDVDRLVVDLRHNGGGDNSTYGPMLDLVGRAAEDLADGAYVAIGRATFSAAGNFVTEADRRTEAMLVGEDSGTSPNQYGDAQARTLEHSKLIYRVASRLTVKSDPDDARLTVEPDIRVDMRSEHFFGDRDPVLEAILD